LTTAEAGIILEAGVLGTPAPQPPGWDHLGAAAVCFAMLALLSKTVRHLIGSDKTRG